jgi:hypothetical protein
MQRPDHLRRSVGAMQLRRQGESRDLDDQG